MLYTRKRHIEGDLTQAVKNTIRLSALATKHLVEADVLQPLAFDYSTLQITLLDRLNLPNNATTFALVRDDLTALLKAIYGDDELSISLVADDPREPFSLLISSNANIDIDTLLERLNTIEAIKS